MKLMYHAERQYTRKSTCGVSSRKLRVQIRIFPRKTETAAHTRQNRSLESRIQTTDMIESWIILRHAYIWAGCNSFNYRE
jgi:hypothetical protein